MAQPPWLEVAICDRLVPRRNVVALLKRTERITKKSWFVETSGRKRGEARGKKKSKRGERERREKRGRANGNISTLLCSWLWWTGTHGLSRSWQTFSGGDVHSACCEDDRASTVGLNRSCVQFVLTDHRSALYLVLCAQCAQSCEEKEEKNHAGSIAKPEESAN